MNRRALVLAATVAAGLARPGSSWAEPAAGKATPAASLERLKAGNARFVADPGGDLPIASGQREALATGERPFALVLSCADSRVPPEVIFNTGLGDLFVVRSIGEVLDRAVVGSLEYGAEQLKAPLLVVMGHEFCSAVKTAAETTPASRTMGPNLDFLIKSIQPAVARSSRSLFEEPLKAAVLANVELVVAELQAQSAVVRQGVERGTLQIVGAYYELSSGRVLFSQPVGAGVAAAPVRTTRVTRPMIEVQEVRAGRGAEASTPPAVAPKAEAVPAPRAPAAPAGDAHGATHAKPKPH